MLRRLLPLAGFLAICTPAFAASVTVDGRRFSVPDGFEVVRIATTNQVLRPVNACLDDRGRLYVTDSSGSSQPPAEQAKDPKWRVIRLEDRDGDGVYETSQVFADRLPMLQGILWHEGVVYIGGTPAIWKLIDQDGDGRAEQRVEWWNVGRPSTHCGNEVHGPYAGPDGFIYWTKGAFEPIAWTNGVAGTAHLDRGAHIFRARPDGSQMDSIMTGGMDNPVEVAFTPDGECLFTSTFIDFTQPGFRDGIAHAIYGGVYGKENSNVEERAVTRTGPDLLHPFVELGAAAPSGLCRYTGSEFGPDHRDNFFASLFNMHKITRHQVSRKGATFEARTTDFLVAEDVDFHPTDVLEDVDGSLIVVDTGGWYKLCCPTSQLWKPDVLGVLYRVKRAGTSGARLARLNRPAASKPLTPTVAKADVAHWQQRVVAAHGEPFALHAVIEALIRLGDPKEMRAALAASELSVQRAALIALAERAGSDLQPAEVTPFLVSADAELRRAADWIIRRRGGEWGPALASWAQEKLPGWMKEGRQAQVKTLFSILLRDSAGQGILADASGQIEYPLPMRGLCLEAMAGANLKETPTVWLKRVGNLLSEATTASDLSSNPAWRGAVSAALRLLRQSKAAGDDTGAHAAAGRLAANPKAPLDLRLEALASRPTRSVFTSAEFEMIRNHLLPEVPPGLRATSVRALTRAALSPEQTGSLTALLRDVGPLEINALLGCFDGVADAEVGNKLVASLRSAKARNALRPEQVKPAFAKFPPETQQAAAELLAEVLPDSRSQVKRIDALLAEMKSLQGDVRRGQAVFNSTKTACVQCHRIGYAGGEVGPNLTRIGEVRSERDLLEAVVYPSASFVRSYEPIAVTTQSGDTVTGIVKDESDAAFTLVVGPGVEQRLARSDVRDQKPGTVSVMPAGLDEQLSRQELLDLVTFLKNTHWGAK